MMIYESLVLVENISQLDESVFSRIITKSDEALVGYLGVTKVTCVTRKYLTQSGFRKWCCGRQYQSIQLAYSITIEDLVYLISRLKMSGPQSFIANVLETPPVGVILTSLRGFVPLHGRFEGQLLQMPSTMDVEFLDNLAELSAGYDVDDYLESLIRGTEDGS